MGAGTFAEFSTARVASEVTGVKLFTVEARAMVAANLDQSDDRPRTRPAVYGRAGWRVEDYARAGHGDGARWASHSLGNTVSGSLGLFLVQRPENHQQQPESHQRQPESHQRQPERQSETVAVSTPADAPPARDTGLLGALDRILSDVSAGVASRVRAALADEKAKLAQFVAAFQKPGISKEEAQRRLNAINDRRVRERLSAGDSTDIADHILADQPTVKGAAIDMGGDLLDIVREDPEAAGALLRHTLTGLDRFLTSNFSEAAALLNRVHSPAEPVVTGGVVPGHTTDKRRDVRRLAAEAGGLMADETDRDNRTVAAQAKDLEKDFDDSVRYAESTQGKNMIAQDPDDDPASAGTPEA
ncbi:hypothetical protein [Kribbella sp. NPDC003557]|uniref:hypothetical protein n=1 Tax=Kribbella sp. NPDC003557 TaxID=3154449 RepID=UPI0033BBC6C7